MGRENAAAVSYEFVVVVDIALIKKWVAESWEEKRRKIQISGSNRRHQPAPLHL